MADDYLNLSQLSTNNPFIMITGLRATGKTNIIKDLLLNMTDIKTNVIISPTEQYDKFYTTNKLSNSVHCKLTADIVRTVIETQVETKKQNKCCFVLDDCIGSLRNKVGEQMINIDGHQIYNDGVSLLYFLVNNRVTYNLAIITSELSIPHWFTSVFGNLHKTVDYIFMLKLDDNTLVQNFLKKNYASMYDTIMKTYHTHSKKFTAIVLNIQKFTNSSDSTNTDTNKVSVFFYFSRLLKA